MKKYPRTTYTKLMQLAKSNENYFADYADEKTELVEFAYIKKLLNEGFTAGEVEAMVSDEDGPFNFRDLVLYR